MKAFDTLSTPQLKELLSRNQEEINCWLEQDAPLDIIYFNIKKLSRANANIIARIKQREETTETLNKFG